LPIRAKKREREQSMTSMCVEKYKRKGKGHVTTHVRKKNMNPKKEKKRYISFFILDSVQEKTLFG